MTQRLIMKVESSGTENTIDVAVKTCKPGAPQALRGLLSETKILAYLGGHPNVVSLIGAHTENLHKGAYLNKQSTSLQESFKDLRRTILLLSRKSICFRGTL